VYRVFVSSTSVDLAAFRQSAVSALSAIDEIECVVMEEFGAQPVRPDNYIRQRLGDVDLVVGIMGDRYGSIVPEKSLSYTEFEYETARVMDKPCLMYCRNPNHSEDRQAAFRRRVQHELTTAPFGSLGDLLHQVERDVARWVRDVDDMRDRTKHWGTFRTRYLSALRDQFDHWRSRYTNLKTTTDIRVATYKGAAASGESEPGAWWFADALRPEGRSDRPRPETVIVLGDPGAGKSTACQNLVRSMAQQAVDRPDDETVPTPIYLELAGVRSQRSEGGATAYQRVLGLLAGEVNRVLARQGTPLQITWERLKTWVDTGPFCFVLDGVNELGLDHRASVIADLVDFVRTFSGKGHQFVLTSRKVDYEYDLLPLLPASEFAPLEILELDAAGMNELVLRELGGYAEILEMLTGCTNKKKRRAAQKALARVVAGVGSARESKARLEDALGGRGAEVLEAFDVAASLVETLQEPDYSRMLWLAQNPATLHDIVRVYATEKQLPHSRVQLAGRAIALRMGIQRSRAGPRRHTVPDEVKYECLERLAMQMMDPGQGLQVPRPDVLTLIRASMSDHGRSTTDAELLLHELLFDDALLVERRYMWFGFAKQPYQEYFVARALARKWASEREAQRAPLNSKMFRQLLDQRTHFNITAQMAGLLSPEQASELIETLWSSRSSRRLAAMCIRNAEKLPDGFVERLTQWARMRVRRLTLLPDDAANVALMTGAAIVVVASATSSWQPLKPWIVTTAGPALADNPGGMWALAVAVIAAGGWGAAGVWRSSIAGQEPKVRVALLAALPIVLVLGLSHSPWGAILATATFLSSIALAMERLFDATSGYAREATEHLEDALVRNRLIPALEILRETGPEGAARIDALKAEVADNARVSKRIKRALELAWTPSPRSVLQLLGPDEDNNIPDIELVRVLVPVLHGVEAQPDVIEQAAAWLARIARQSSDHAAAHRAIRELQSLAASREEYVEFATRVLQDVLAGSDRAIRLRLTAWAALRDLGVAGCPLPRPVIAEALRGALPAAVVVTAILGATLAVAWLFL